MKRFLADLKRFLLSGYGVFFVGTWIVYLVVDYLGEIGGLALNGRCVALFGCTDGFFGFDAFEHFLSGFALAITIALVFRHFPKVSLFSAEFPRWKQALVLVLSIATIAVLWELVESAHDVFRVAILHQPLYNLRLHIDLLDQPSNLDTMGDMAFNILGAILGAFFARYATKRPVPEA